MDTEWSQVRKTRRMRPAIPWREMSGMRDKLIHDSIGVDAEIVWTTVEDRLPALASEIESLFQPRKSSSRWMQYSMIPEMAAAGTPRQNTCHLPATWWPSAW